MDKESLRRWLERDLGIKPTEGDLAALMAELAALAPALERWRRLDLWDAEPAFLVRGVLPRKAR